MTSPTEELLWRPVCYGEAVYLVSDFLRVRVMDVERLTLSADDGVTVSVFTGSPSLCGTVEIFLLLSVFLSERCDQRISD